MNKLELPKYYDDPIFGHLIKQVIRIVDKAYGKATCEYEYGESYYGAGDALPCGREAVGTSIEAEEPRCRQHLNEE